MKWNRLLVLALVGCVASAGGGCVFKKKKRTSYGSEQGEVKNLFQNTTGVKFVYEDEPVQIPPAGSLLLDITQPELLTRLQDNGLHLSQILEQGKFGWRGKKTTSNFELAASSPWYLQVVSALESQIDSHSKTDPDFDIRPTEGKNRLFDKRWLKSKYADFDLVGVVNRVDRMDFSEAKNCGEMRLIYRLNYFKSQDDPPVFSRLPFLMNVVFETPRHGTKGTWEDCVEDARVWKTPRAFANPDEYINWLTSKGAPLDIGRVNFKQLELNFQVSRIPSGTKTDFGGHAEYFMRIFTPNGAKDLEAAPLENTPDVDVLLSNPSLKSELADFIKNNIVGIDAGVVKLPEKFLAKTVTSYTTHGLNRLANKPFTRLFKASDLNGIDFSKTAFLNSPESVLLRLDDMTCAGCHQGNSVAGFHMVGVDRPSHTHPLNALRMPYSPHFLSERSRRQSYMWNFVAGVWPGVKRPLSFQAHPDLGSKPGARCILDAEKKLFKETWDCDNTEPSHCELVDKNPDMVPQIGVCVRNNPSAGDVCSKGTIQSNRRDPRLDTLESTTFACTAPDATSGYVCFDPVQGTPAGMCYRKCQEDRAGNLVAPRPEHELCAYNGGATFDECAASGNFASCLLSSVSRGTRAACDEKNPCRDDFICQKFFLVDSASNKITVPTDTRGYCVPNYFVFQMRLDGHPEP